MLSAGTHRFLRLVLKRFPEEVWELKKKRSHVNFASIQLIFTYLFNSTEMSNIFTIFKQISVITGRLAIQKQNLSPTKLLCCSSLFVLKSNLKFRKMKGEAEISWQLEKLISNSSFDKYSSRRIKCLYFDKYLLKAATYLSVMYNEMFAFWKNLVIACGLDSWHTGEEFFSRETAATDKISLWCSFFVNSFYLSGNRIGNNLNFFLQDVV